MSEIAVGDWVVVMNDSLLPYEEDGSSYCGIPGKVASVDGDKIELYSPLKVCFGRPPVDSVPIRQLIKITEEEGNRYIKDVKSHETYRKTRGI
jgi:hypothetical protein